MRLRRARFRDLIARQLDLFEHDHADDIAETAERLARYDTAGRDEAEEHYGDYQDVVDAVVDALEDVRTAYAATLDQPEAEEYEREFARAARRRLPRFPLTG